MQDPAGHRGSAKAHDMRAAALQGKIPSLQMQEAFGFLPCPIIWPVTRRVVRPRSDSLSAHRCSCCCSCSSIRRPSAAEHQPTLISRNSYHLIGAYVHSYSILHSLQCPLVQEEQGTCAYCQGCRRRRWGCRDGAVANTSPPPAALQEFSCWLVGRQERSAPSVLPPRRTGYWTAQPLPPPTLGPFHTHHLRP